MHTVLGIQANDVLMVSGKIGDRHRHGVRGADRAHSGPVGQADARSPALVFDSKYDNYRGRHVRARPRRPGIAPGIEDSCS